MNDEAVKMPVSQVTEDSTAIQDAVSREEQIRLAQERIRKLKDITLKMKSPEGLAALENKQLLNVRTLFSRTKRQVPNRVYRVIL